MIFQCLFISVTSFLIYRILLFKNRLNVGKIDQYRLNCQEIETISIIKISISFILIIYTEKLQKKIDLGQFILVFFRNIFEYDLKIFSYL